MSAGRWWLCWSPSQQAVDVRSEAESCEKNLSDFVLNRPVDYVTLAVFNDDEAAREFGRQIQEMRNRRQGGAASWN